jgi:hypothetical protein
MKPIAQQPVYAATLSGSAAARLPGFLFLLRLLP